MTQLTPNFSLEELTTTNQPFDNTPPPGRMAFIRALASKLQFLRDSVGCPLYINSAFRSREVNRAVGGVPRSRHLMGEAADISIRNLSPEARSRLETAISLSKPCQFFKYPTFWHVAYDFYTLGIDHTSVTTMEECFPNEFQCVTSWSDDDDV